MWQDAAYALFGCLSLARAEADKGSYTELYENTPDVCKPHLRAMPYDQIHCWRT